MATILYSVILILFYFGNAGVLNAGASFNFFSFESISLLSAFTLSYGLLALAAAYGASKDIKAIMHGVSLLFIVGVSSSMLGLLKLPFLEDVLFASFFLSVALWTEVYALFFLKKSHADNKSLKTS
jgi:hypothetical protein